MMADSNPELLVFDHGGFEDFPLHSLQDYGRTALPLCLEHPAGEGGVLKDLKQIEVNLVGDDVISRVHDEFLGDPTPTDVITFHHGEIVISLETAEREGEKHGHSTEQEALLYLIHALLHLNGHEDKTPEQRMSMHEVQENILAEVWKG